MSGIGFSELIILLMIGLIVLGPERLPRVANQLGSWLGQARRMTRVMKRQLEDELNFEQHFDIDPPDRTRHANFGSAGAQAAASAPPDPPGDKDDTYSPAHGSDAAGTGVGDDKPPEDDAGGHASATPADDGDGQANPDDGDEDRDKTASP
ncbi:MAG: Sec-independent protein translocase protein TatB [Woeseiaceae bacterium]|nr:Sec-independent protein translocase protein TatB [Woeseiaceae bacterium]